MSNDKRQQALFKAIFKLLRPLVRLLLRNGIPFRAFADIAKEAYVDVAFKDFQVKGKKQTDSRVATITGLSRKEVSRVKNIQYASDTNAIERYNRAARVVFGWVHDKEYADENGETALLKFDTGQSNFSSLVKKYSGDVPPRAILDELIQVGVVTKTDNEQYQLLERAYIPKASEMEKLRILGSDVAGLLSTLDYNIHKLGDEPYFQRKVFYDNLPEEAIPEIRSMLAESGQQLLEIIDQTMAKHDRDVNPDVEGTGRKGVGIGLYYFEDDEIEESDNESK